MLLILYFASFYFLICASSASAISSEESTHAIQYDYLNIEKILIHEHLLKRLMDCLMDQGPCTIEGKELKRLIPNVIQNNCNTCNRRQKMITERALTYFLHYRPDYWFLILNKFDQDSSFRQRMIIDSNDHENGNETGASSRKTRSITSVMLNILQKYQKFQKLKELKKKKKQILLGKE